MSDDDEQPSAAGPFEQFRVPCPNCSGGVRHRSRATADGEIAFIPQRCRDCGGNGWLALGSGEWKRRGPTA